MTVQNTQDNQGITEIENVVNRKGMVLPFQPLSLSFDHVNYFVDMPAVSLSLPDENMLCFLSTIFKNIPLIFGRCLVYQEMKSQGIEETRLQLLRDVSGAFRPGVLTALMGVSGAGKTTLMDVLAGRKTGGYIEGNISISGYLKNQETFARVSGYCEQNDIHSPHVTVYESLLYSSWLRLPASVNTETRKVCSFLSCTFSLIFLSLYLKE